MSWFEKLRPSTIRTEASVKKNTVPEGLWSKCPECSAILYNSELEKIQPMIKYEMENAFTLNVPLTVEIGQGKDWLAAH